MNKPKPKSKINKNFVILIVLILATVFAFVVYSRRSLAPAVESDRSTIYVIAGGLGGSCLYYMSNNNGSAQGECVDENSFKKLVVDAYPQEKYGALGDSDHVLLLDADVTVKKERRSGATPTPQYKEESVVYLNKVYSVKQLEITQNN